MTDAVSTPHLLWHYTSVAGLIGIVTKQEIWATDAMFLNDTREVLEALDLLTEEVRSLGEQTSMQIKSVADLRLALYVAASGDATVVRPGASPYVACFCEKSDLLSQWRNYANGSGYAIGFDRSRLQASAERHGGVLRKVTYLPRDQPDALVLQRTTLLGGGPGPAQIVADPDVLAEYKNRAFEEEHEWRVILPTARHEHGINDKLPPVQYREGLVGLTPYVTLALGDSSIVEIKVGPGGDQALHRLAVERLVTTREITVSVSTAPFRG